MSGAPHYSGHDAASIASSGNLDPAPGSRDSRKRRTLSATFAVQEPPASPQGAPIPDGVDNVVYPPTSKQVMTMGSLALVVFLISLDRTILATATPAITDEFDSISQVGWYASSYALTMAAFMLLFGRIYTFYNPKAVFLSCILLFETGSAICGAAPNSIAFIFGRAISGIGASAIMGGTMVIIFVTIPLARRPFAQATMSAVWGISAVVGPVLGGAFTTDVTWRWCFYINLPVGAAVWVYLFFSLQMPAAREANLPLTDKLLKLDPLGNLVFIPAFICLLLALQWGGSEYAWSNWRIILLLVLFGVLLAAFVGIQLHSQENATIPPRILAQRSIAFGSISNIFSGATLTILTYYLPIWFQAIEAISAEQSGVRNLPMVITLGLASTLTGALVSRIGYYTPFMIVGFAISSVGAGLLSMLTSTATTGQWLGYQIPFGFGYGMAMQQANIAAQTILTRKDIGTGAALMFFAQSIGGSIFVSIAQTTFSNRLTSDLNKNIPGLDPKLIMSVGATDLYDAIPENLRDQVLVAYNNALTKGPFYVAVATSVCACVTALGVEWRSVKAKQRDDPARLANPESYELES